MSNSHGDFPFVRPQEGVPDVTVVSQEHLLHEFNLFFLGIFGNYINEKEVSRKAIRRATCVSESGLMGEGVRQ